MKRLVAAVALCNLLSTLISLYQWNLLIVDVVSTTFFKLQQGIYSAVERSCGKVCKLRKRSHRTCWVRPGRTDAWWMSFIIGVVVDYEWKENFRMGKNNFSNFVMNSAHF